MICEDVIYIPSGSMENVIDPYTKQPYPNKFRVARDLIKDEPRRGTILSIVSMGTGAHNIGEIYLKTVQYLYFKIYH